MLANKPRSYREALRLHPDLVVCDRVTPAVEAIVRSWIKLPAGTNLVLDDPLSVIDRTEELINEESLERANADSVG